MTDMKTVKAWALVWSDGDMYGDTEDLHRTRHSAHAALRAFRGIVCAGGETIDRIARVEIREIP